MDKKKKIFMSKESAAMRRPVILKSDRDVSKEPTKEKEKPPTIILKTREQSTSKDERPHSPKQSEGEVPPPSKIAHNEHKEKKSTDSKPNPPLKLMSEPIKVVDENLEFNHAALEFLHDANTNYLIVGVIGTQGVGKSMVLNLLAENVLNEDLCTRILHSHEIPTEQPAECVGIDTHMGNLSFAETEGKQHRPQNQFHFKMQNIEQIEKGIHCTKGVDMFVTENRVILLDCQALWSPALVEETANPVASRNASAVTVDCLQLAAFLMAVCHVLIAVQDWFADYNFLRYIQTAEMLRPSLSASSSLAATSAGDGESTSGGDVVSPHLLLLHNRCQLEDFTPQAVDHMQRLYEKVFLRSSLQLRSGMGAGGAGGATVNLCLLPDVPATDDGRMYRGHPSFVKLAAQLRCVVLGVHRHQITNVQNLSEKSWFHYCAKAWETIRKCTFFMEYERFLP